MQRLMHKREASLLLFSCVLVDLDVSLLLLADHKICIFAEPEAVLDLGDLEGAEKEAHQAC